MGIARNIARLVPNGSGQLPTANLQDSAITSVKIADAAIVEADLANSAVTTNKINNSAITREKMGYSGAILQVVSNTPTSATGYSQSTSSYAEISADYRTSITPVASNSILILDFEYLFGGNNSGNISTMKIYDVTNNAEVGLSGFSSGSRGLGHGSMRCSDNDNNDRHSHRLRAYITSGSTSSRTYGIFHYSENGVTKYFNQTPVDNNGCSWCKWSFIITEVAA